jgi:hypothetical protein
MDHPHRDSRSGGKFASSCQGVHHAQRAWLKKTIGGSHGASYSSLRIHVDQARQSPCSDANAPPELSHHNRAPAMIY